MTSERTNTGVHPGPDPFPTLRAWLEEAELALPERWSSMALATATPDGRPSARIVLLRVVDERGLVFFTNRESRKGAELRANPRDALVLHWWELGRQVRVEGPVEELEDDRSDAYWRTRPRASRLAAWASPQSAAIEADELHARLEEHMRRFAQGDVPRPEFWGGYRVVPEAVELWTHDDDRLHERILYRRSGAGWERSRLAP